MTGYSKDWDNITDSAERKKVQNRIAQRTYRNRLKKRIVELEQLNKALNSQAPFPPQLHDEEISGRQQSLPPPIPNTPSEPVYGIDTLRDGNIGSVEDSHATMNRRSHRRNQISKPPQTFQDNGTSPPDATSPLPHGRLITSTSQASMGYSLGALFPDIATTLDDLSKTPSKSNNMGFMPQDRNSVVSDVESFNWGLDTDSEMFFPLAQEQTNRSVTRLGDALDLNVTKSLQPSLLPQTSDDRTTLHLAVENNRLYIVQLLLSRHADIRAQDRWGYTALHIAAMRGHEELTSLLLSCCTTSSSSSTSSSTSSSSSGSEHSSSQQVAFIEMTDAAGCTALHHAADNGYAGIVETLLVAGANPRAQNGTGATLLHLAAAGGHEAVVISLFQTATINSGRRSGDTLTPSSGQSTSPNNKNNDGITSSRNNCSAILSPSHAKSFQDQLNTPTGSSATPSNDNNVPTPWSPMLTPLRDLPHIKDSYGTTPFHVAAESGLSLRIVNILLSVGAAIDVLDTRGFSPLHYAAHRGHEDIVRVLLDSGASVKMKVRYGWTALHLAVQGAHDGVVAMLLEGGAEVDERVEAWNLCTEHFQDYAPPEAKL